MQELEDRIIDRIVREYQLVLVENKKAATLKTFRSIRGEGSTTVNKILVRIFANISLQFIISGRRPGAKLPVRKGPDGFELVPELQEWVRAVGFTGNHYLLARKIAERGIPATPITAVVLARVRPDVITMIQEHAIGQTRERVFADLRASFRGI